MATMITALTGTTAESYSASQLTATTAGTTAQTTTAQTATTQTTTTQTTAAQEQDDVKLSAAAQAKLLHQQGQSVQVIASSLGATVKQVDDYLGITLQEQLQKTIEETAQLSTTKS